MADYVKLYYDPLFTPGDILLISGYEQVGIVTGSKDAGVIEEITEGKPQRMFMVLFWNADSGFVIGEFRERFLKEKAERKGHINYGEMTCEETDVAEVLTENRMLKARLNTALGATEHFRNMANKREDRNA